MVFIIFVYQPILYILHVYFITLILNLQIFDIGIIPALETKWSQHFFFSTNFYQTYFVIKCCISSINTHSFFLLKQATTKEIYLK